MKSEQLDVSQWKIFEFKDIFSFERGKRYKKECHIGGDVPYVSSTKFNNGIDGYVVPPEYMKIYRNTLTLNNSGSIGYCFYHPYKFVCSDHCTVINILDEKQKINIYLALFLKPIIEKIKIKYGFSREMSDDRLRKENVFLPANSHGQPDWKSMEEYIKNKSENIIYDNKEIIHKLHSNKRLDTSDWKTFSISAIFNKDIIRGKRFIESDRVGGDVPYYSTSDFNNGLTDMVGNPLFTEKDALIYTTFGRCFYVVGEFTGSDEILIFKHDKLNLYNGLFLATVLDQSKDKYDFGRKAFLNKVSIQKIKLPIDKDGNIDWNFMESYIKSLRYSSNL